MSNNKYNIEEVFKSELEDFEMDMPQNAWSNISNNINAPVSSSLLSGTVAQVVTLFAVAGIIGAVITFSITNQTEKENQAEQPVIEVEKKSEVKHEEVITKETSKEEKSIAEELKPQKVVEKEITTYIVEKEKEEQNRTPVNTINNAKVETTQPTEATSFLNEQTETTVNEEVAEDNSVEEIKIIEVNSIEIVADIFASPVGGYAPLLVEFSHATKNVKSNWNFGDGVESEAQKVTHTFNKPGTYTVELLLTSKDGTTSVAQSVIEVLSTSKIESIPNIFTPNNDGENDLFVIKSNDIKEFSLFIFERNGTAVYETNDIEKGWNGENKYGEQVLEGKYFYLIKAVGTDGKQYKEKGVVRLER